MKKIFTRRNLTAGVIVVMAIIIVCLVFAVTRKDNYIKQVEALDKESVTETYDDGENVEATNDSLSENDNAAMNSSNISEESDVQVTDVPTVTINPKGSVTSNVTYISSEDAISNMNKDKVAGNQIEDSSIEDNDNGELNLEDGVPGEAVPAITNYVSIMMYDREKTRKEDEDALWAIVHSTDASEDSKKDAENSIIELNQIIEKEDTAESSLQSQGLNALVIINDDSVEVLISADSLTDQQIAMINDTVKDKTGISKENIHITVVTDSE